MKGYIIISLSLLFCTIPCNSKTPVVITTWKFTSAAAEAWRVVQDSSALDAIEQGCSVCEINQCDGTVGYGGSPDENGETTLDAMIMDGRDMNVGAVFSLRRIKNVISVARRVLEHTSHSILTGDLATKFAIEMGFKEESLSTNTSLKMYQDWKKNNCQPNYWINVVPDPSKYCGPYKIDDIKQYNKLDRNFDIGIDNHDTIGMVVIDNWGNIAAGTSTNGMKHKIPGRVGDSPIPGSGAYADNKVGGAAATGDGDVMLRFLPSFLAVEEMRRGSNPSEATQIAISRIVSYYPKFSGGIVAVDKDGNYGAACNGMENFPFSIANPITNKVNVEYVSCKKISAIQL